MGPDLELYPAPGKKNVRVVAFRLRDFAQPHGKIECAPKIGEGVLLFQMVLSNHLPVGAELLMKPIELLSAQRRDASATRNAVF